MFKTFIYVSTFQSKATTIKDALRRWEEKNGIGVSEATEVLLCFQWPPIEKMDNSLAVLVNCE
jgi:dynein light chain 1